MYIFGAPIESEGLSMVSSQFLINENLEIASLLYIGITYHNFEIDMYISAIRIYLS